MIQGLGKVSFDERWQCLQLHGQERFERRHAGAFQMRKNPHKGGAMDFMSED